MAQGLGENTPIILQLSRENFNALISRHGQYVRWLSSQKCSCVKKNRHVNAACSICHGSGYIYGRETDSENIIESKVAIDGVVSIPDNAGIIWVRDASGNELTVVEYCGNYASVPGTVKGQTVFVNYIESLLKTGTGTAVYIGNKTFRVDLPIKTKTGVVQGDLNSVSIETGTVDDIFRNTFTIEEDAITTDLPVSYSYIEPNLFAILSQTQNRMERQWLVDMGGDASMTFPQRWKVSEGDIIIALNSTSIKKDVIVASGSETDRLLDLYISSVSKCTTIRSDELHEFVYGTDFVLFKDNLIKWISLNRPIEGEYLSMVYEFNVSYKVNSENPSPRTSENNVFARKVALKAYTGRSGREQI